MSVRIGSFGTSDSDLRFQEVVEGNLIRCLGDTVILGAAVFPRLLKPASKSGSPIPALKRRKMAFGSRSFQLLRRKLPRKMAPSWH